MYLIGFPLLLIPLAIYNIIAFLFRSGFSDTVFTIRMMSGATLTVSTGDLLIIFSILLLFVEILKATRFGVKSIIDHMLSFVIFVVAAGRVHHGAAGRDLDLPPSRRALRGRRGGRLLDLDPARAARSGDRTRYRLVLTPGGRDGRTAFPALCSHDPRFPSARTLAGLRL